MCTYLGGKSLCIDAYEHIPQGESPYALMRMSTNLGGKSLRIDAYEHIPQGESPYALMHMCTYLGGKSLRIDDILEVLEGLIVFSPQCVHGSPQQHGVGDKHRMACGPQEHKDMYKDIHVSYMYPGGTCTCM